MMQTPNGGQILPGTSERPLGGRHGRGDSPSHVANPPTGRPKRNPFIWHAHEVATKLEGIKDFEAVPKRSLIGIVRAFQRAYILGQYAPSYVQKAEELCLRWKLPHYPVAKHIFNSEFRRDLERIIASYSINIPQMIVDQCHHLNSETRALWERLAATFREERTRRIPTFKGSCSGLANTIKRMLFSSGAAEPPPIWVLCPFHDDHSPSAWYNPYNNWLSCFACRTTLSAFALTKKLLKGWQGQEQYWVGRSWIFYELPENTLPPELITITDGECIDTSDLSPYLNRRGPVRVRTYDGIGAKRYGYVESGTKWNSHTKTRILVDVDNCGLIPRYHTLSLQLNKIIFSFSLLNIQRISIFPDNHKNTTKAA